jgi:hypothetical protein
MQVGLLKGTDLSVDSTHIGANASPDRAISRDQLVDVAKVNRTVRQYVEQVERENVVAEPEQTSAEDATEAKEWPKLSRRSQFATLQNLHHRPRFSLVQ